MSVIFIFFFLHTVKTDLSDWDFSCDEEIDIRECREYCEYADECVPEGYSKPLEHWQRCTSHQEEEWIKESNRLMEICWNVIKDKYEDLEEKNDHLVSFLSPSFVISLFTSHS